MSTDSMNRWVAHAVEVAAARREAEVLGALVFVAAATGQPLWRILAAASEPAGWSDHVKARIAAALELHSPVETEAEFYCHDDRGRPADEGCATFDECPGHMLPMTVCSECGHDHEDGYPMYRPYPCPTRRALET